MGALPHVNVGYDTYSASEVSAVGGKRAWKFEGSIFNYGAVTFTAEQITVGSFVFVENFLGDIEVYEIVSIDASSTGSTLICTATFYYSGDPQLGGPMTGRSFVSEKLPPVGVAVIPDLVIVPISEYLHAGIINFNDAKIEEAGTGGEGTEEYVDIIAAEDTVSGDLINIYNDGGVAKARKARADIIGCEASGFVKEAASTGSTVRVYMEGLNEFISGLLPGKTYFLSNTPGQVTNTISSPPAFLFAQTVGTAGASGALAFERQEPYYFE